VAGFVKLLQTELLRLGTWSVTPLALLIGALLGLLGVLVWPAIKPGGDGDDTPLSSHEASGRFGAFAGVFTPSILTILGVIMYLRVGWVVGNVGLGGALAVVVIAHLITAATGLSIASISTNRTVGVGGAYFIISRTLGAPAGAAIGIPLFLAQALSVTFYIVGFTESLSMLVGGLPEQAISSVILLLLALLSMKSADLAIKVQFLVMTAIALSLVSFFGGWQPSGGLSQAANQITWWVTDRAPFSQVFAVFFPAVTGIMAGVGMSGDLKDPRHAIPRGTLIAIGVGFLVYLAFPVWLALNANSQELAQNNRVVWSISRVPALIYVGVWGATLSSAVGSILTAPRTLQALALDELIPRLFGRGVGPENEPRVGVLMTYALAQGGILLGGLDVIAPVLTMFFLATYGLLNLACALERWAASPSFRPELRVPTVVSLLGGIGCLYVMSIINLPAMGAAALFCGAIYAFTQRRALSTTYGDARHGMWAALVRSALQWLRTAEWHPTNWRPNLLVLGGAPEKRPWLLELGSAIVQDRGIVTYVRLLSGDLEELVDDWRILRRDLDERLLDQFPNVFGKVEVVRDKYRGAVAIAQAYGLGTLEANTILLGWPTRIDNASAYLRMLRHMAMLDRSLLIVAYNSERAWGKRRRIDIWWGGLEGNGGLMLLTAHLIAAHLLWINADITIRTIVDSEARKLRAQARIKEVLTSSHIEAAPAVILRNGRTIHDVMVSHSKDADLSIVGLRLPEADDAPERFFVHVEQLLEGMPTTILVHSARNFEGEPVLFDDGATRPSMYVAEGRDK
jgi:solute carrier family 12 (sodium/potassium/chloride transporter), member 2